ncbi:phosphotransferase [Streptomyces sp. NPDC012935]|uniref:phosphotransferase n=1 Tax=Streptomyces sp. NPDC012935 TaxID=3364857 RepID=UPI00367AE91C
MGTFRQFLDSEFPQAHVTQLSDTNNPVFLVSSPEAGQVVVKHVTDTDIPLSYLARVNEELSRHIPVQRVLRVFEADRGDPFDALFCEYVEGRNLADELGGGGPLPDADIAGQLCDYVRACAHLPQLYEGFGLYKRGASSMATHREFVEYYGRRYWNRARHFYEGTSVAAAVDRWLDGGFAAAAARNPVPPRVISADANLKNWIVEPGGRLRVLNVPIAGLSTPAHAVGAVSLHLRNSPLHKEFLTTATATLCQEDAEMVPHFELWGLLGILSFYAVREPERQREWPKWGSTVLLDTDFRNLVESEIMPVVM